MLEETKGLFIDGKWVKKQRTYELHAPYDGQLLACISRQMRAMWKKRFRGSIEPFKR
jgi:hypothetical protein